jgi:hypothetical protein
MVEAFEPTADFEALQGLTSPQGVVSPSEQVRVSYSTKLADASNQSQTDALQILGHLITDDVGFPDPHPDFLGFQTNGDPIDLETFFGPGFAERSFTSPPFVLSLLNLFTGDTLAGLPITKEGISGLMQKMLQLNHAEITSPAFFSGFSRHPNTGALSAGLVQQIDLLVQSMRQHDLIGAPTVENNGFVSPIPVGSAPDLDEALIAWRQSPETVNIISDLVTLFDVEPVAKEFLADGSLRFQGTAIADILRPLDGRAFVDPNNPLARIPDESLQHLVRVFYVNEANDRLFNQMAGLRDSLKLIEETTKVLNALQDLLNSKLPEGGDVTQASYIRFAETVGFKNYLRGIDGATDNAGGFTLKQRLLDFQAGVNDGVIVTSELDESSPDFNLETLGDPLPTDIDGRSNGTTHDFDSFFKGLTNNQTVNDRKDDAGVLYAQDVQAWEQEEFDRALGINIDGERIALTDSGVDEAILDDFFGNVGDGTTSDSAFTKLWIENRIEQLIEQFGQAFPAESGDQEPPVVGTLRQIRTDLQSVDNFRTYVADVGSSFVDGSGTSSSVPLDGNGLVNMNDVNEADRGFFQDNVSQSFISSQTLNDGQREKVREQMFVYEEYIKSASAMIAKLTQIIEKIAQGIRG